MIYFCKLCSFLSRLSNFECKCSHTSLSTILRVMKMCCFVQAKFRLPLFTLHIFYTPHLPYSSFSIRFISHTLRFPRPHFPTSSFFTPLIFHPPHFPHTSLFALLTFHTPHFPRYSFSTPFNSHTLYFPHSSFSTLPFSTVLIFRTPDFPHSLFCSD